jgi:hypothetical protein
MSECCSSGAKVRPSEDQAERRGECQREAGDNPADDWRLTDQHRRGQPTHSCRDEQPCIEPLTLARLRKGGFTSACD